MSPKSGPNVQKTVENPHLQFSDKVDMPVVVNDRCCGVPQVQFIDGLAVIVIMQRQVVSRTVEVPRIQFIARVCRHSSSL